MIDTFRRKFQIFPDYDNQVIWCAATNSLLYDDKIPAMSGKESWPTISSGDSFNCQHKELQIGQFPWQLFTTQTPPESNNTGTWGPSQAQSDNVLLKYQTLLDVNPSPGNVFQCS